MITAWILSFAAGLALDYASARYVAAVAADRVGPASAWSVVMYLLSTAGLYGFVEVSVWLAVPTCAGLAAGTVLAMRPPPWRIPRARSRGGGADSAR